MKITRNIKLPGLQQYEIHDVHIELEPKDIGFIGGNPLDYQEARQVVMMLIREAELAAWNTFARAGLITKEEYDRRLAGFSTIPDALLTRAPVEKMAVAWIIDETDPDTWHAYAGTNGIAVCRHANGGMGIQGPVVEKPKDGRCCKKCEVIVK